MFDTSCFFCLILCFNIHILHIHGVLFNLVSCSINRNVTLVAAVGFGSFLADIDRNTVCYVLLVDESTCLMTYKQECDTQVQQRQAMRSRQ